MLTELIEQIYTAICSLSFDTLMGIAWGSFAAIFVLAILLCLRIPKIRSSSKRPFLCLVNAYAAVTVAAFLTVGGTGQAIFAAALFWCAGYLCYGLLCLLTKEKKREITVMQPVISAMPPMPAVSAAPSRAIRNGVPAAKSNVRLEHAITVTDSLLLKNLGRGDRQELEKLKNTLAVLQLKGTLTPAESDILNENFGALLKMMAKYNV